MVYEENQSDTLKELLEVSTPDLKLYYRAIVIKNYMVLVQEQTG